MDNQKTGALIAQRRTELGLTQKQLAEQLTLSDRTISRWERGVGFPDISLLEPLADALGLSVLELLRGERMEEPHEDAESAIRDAARTFSTTFKASIKRFWWALVILAVIAVASLYGFLRLWSQGYLDPHIIHAEEIPASDALSICPFALITTEEYKFIQALLQDEEITSHLSAEFDENQGGSSSDIFSADDSILSRYDGMLHIEEEPATLIEISTVHSMICVTYESRPKRCYLIISPHRDTVEKTCARYEDGDEFEVLYAIINENNQAFSMAKESSKFSLLLSE